MFDPSTTSNSGVAHQFIVAAIGILFLASGGCGSEKPEKKANQASPTKKNPAGMPTNPSAFFEEFDFHKTVESLSPQIDWIKAGSGKSNKKSNQGPQWKLGKDWRVLCKTTSAPLQVLMRQLRDQLASACTEAGLTVEQNSHEDGIIDIEYRLDRLRGSVRLQINPPKSGSRMPSGEAPTHEIECRITEWNYAG